MIVLIALALLGADPVPSAPATKAQKVELARLQRLRDSLVASRWEARRQDLAERDAYQEEFNQVRDSLESVRQDRSQIDQELRRLVRDQSPSAASVPVVANPADPLDGIRRNLAGRLEALRSRVETGIPWATETRLAKVDSARKVLSANGSVELALPGVLEAWRAEWRRATSIDVGNGPLPRPEGDPQTGKILIMGALGGWYVADDGSVVGALSRSGPGGAWEWREDLSDSAAAILRDPSRGLTILDPGIGQPEGPGFFRDTHPRTWKDKLAEVFNFRKGPLHWLALWAARAVMALLLFLGGLVAWTGWGAHRRLVREERDATAYEAVILPAMESEKDAKNLAATLPDTFAGRLCKQGLSSRHLSPEALEQVLSATESSEQRKMERGMSRLGTIGSNAPFIGLFGTVCGILDAFAALGQEGGGPQAVMSAIAEALVATAVGLAVAIPAIWVFNALQGRAIELGARARELRTLLVASALQAAARRERGT